MTTRRRHFYPRLELLEGREVPAGAITASISHGKLTITGDDQADGLTLWVTPISVVFTPDDATSVNGLAPQTVLILPGTVTSLSARLAGGNDSLSIDATNDFVLTGTAAIDLGDGKNTLNLTTTGHITLGSLAVTSGDASNTVTVSAGAGLGTVTGPASFSFGAGGGDQVTLNEMKFLGATGLKVTAGKGGGIAAQATNVTVAKTLSINTGNAPGAVQTFTGSSLGGLALTGTAPYFILDSSTVKGNVSDHATFACLGGLNDTVVTGDVTITAGFEGALVTSGNASARNVSISGGIVGVGQVTGKSTTISGRLSVTGGVATVVSFATTGLSEVKGNVVVRGGGILTSLQSTGQFKADRNVTVTSGDGPTSVTIGDTTAAAAILGNLTIKASGGPATVGLTDLTVGKATRITAGGGVDGLTIDGSTFQGAFAADLGGGDDTIAIAQATGMAAPVTFTGRATITAGSGNDTLLLGLATGGPGGDAHSRVVVSAPTSRIDGGTGLNTFDGLTPDQSPAQYTGLTVNGFMNWADPTP
jgi:hypothetical protein